MRSLLISDTYDDGDATMDDEEAEYEVLLRCTQDENKFSTRVSVAGER